MGFVVLLFEDGVDESVGHLFKGGADHLKAIWVVFCPGIATALVIVVVLLILQKFRFLPVFLAFQSEFLDSSPVITNVF